MQASDGYPASMRVACGPQTLAEAFIYVGVLILGMVSQSRLATETSPNAGH